MKGIARAAVREDVPANRTGSSDTGTLATIPSGLRPTKTRYPLMSVTKGVGGHLCHITTAGALADITGIPKGDALQLDG